MLVECLVNIIVCETKVNSEFPPRDESVSGSFSCENLILTIIRNSYGALVQPNSKNILTTC